MNIYEEKERKDFKLGVVLFTILAVVIAVFLINDLNNRKDVAVNNFDKVYELATTLENGIEKEIFVLRKDFNYMEYQLASFAHLAAPTPSHPPMRHRVPDVAR